MKDPTTTNDRSETLKPIGIILLSVFNLANILWMIYGLKITPLTVPGFVEYFLIIAIFILASIGLWKGASWGWWISLFSYINGLNRGINMLILFFLTYKRYPYPLNIILLNTAQYHFANILYIGFSILLLRSPSLNHFKIPPSSRIKALVILIPISILITTIFIILSFFGVR